MAAAAPGFVSSFEWIDVGHHRGKNRLVRFEAEDGQITLRLKFANKRKDKKMTPDEIEAFWSS